MSDKIEDIQQDFENAIMTPSQIEEDIAFYENLHGFSSEKLLEMAAAGTLPDSFEIQAWLILLNYRS